MRVPAALAALLLAGCLRPGSSEPPAAWRLPDSEAAPAFPVRVFLPAELRRPSVVTREPGEAPRANDLDRWSAPLPAELARVAGAELAGLPLRSVTVEFLRLEAGRGGGLRLEATARLELATSADGRTAPLTLQVSRSASTGKGSPSVGKAVEAYALSARLVGRAIRDRVGEELGEVAKPAPSVTVPGQ